MIGVIRDEIRSLDVSPRALRSFGWTVGGAFLVLALFSWWRNDWEVTPFALGLTCIGVALAGVGTIAPRWLRRVYVAWMIFALALGHVVSQILLTLAFLLVVTPMALILRIIRKDPLKRSIRPAAGSYWRPKAYDDETPERLRKFY